MDFIDFWNPENWRRTFANETTFEARYIDCTGVCSAFDISLDENGSWKAFFRLPPYIWVKEFPLMPPLENESFKAYGERILPQVLSNLKEIIHALPLEEVLSDLDTESFIWDGSSWDVTEKEPCFGNKASFTGSGGMWKDFCYRKGPILVKVMVYYGSNKSLQSHLKKVKAQLEDFCLGNLDILVGEKNDLVG